MTEQGFALSTIHMLTYAKKFDVMELEQNIYMGEI